MAVPVYASIHAQSCTEKFVNMSYKPLMGSSPNMQLWCNWG